MTSTKNPFMVHYRTSGEAETAQKVVGYLDNAWEFEVKVLGFAPPPPDNGVCGPNDLFDVFILRGQRSCCVDVISEQIVTAWGARASFMILDPWGPYGGESLNHTIGHEFNHACQAEDDWHEIGISFEMTATYIEQYFGEGCASCIRDFQGRPDWSVLWFDDYNSEYMYGSAIYFNFLKDRYFPADEGFPARVWFNARNIPNPYVNKPNFVDGTDAILAPLGSSFMDSVPVFERWRYFAGSRDDGGHFKKWPLPSTQLPFFIGDADIKLHAAIRLADTVYKVDPPLMLLGSAYIEVLQDQGGRESFNVSVSTTPPEGSAFRLVLQAVPGVVAGSDGDTIDLSTGSARVPFASGGKRTLIITLMPAAAFDPDNQSGQTFPVSVHLAP
ncbi:MAG: hypothetical protein WC889_16370 [Myxococcota bacterium]|jgi:hypothetical protein